MRAPECQIHRLDTLGTYRGLMRISLIMLSQPYVTTKGFRRGKKKALFVSIKIQRTYAIMFFNNFQVFNSAILRFNKSQWTGQDRK